MAALPDLEHLTLPRQSGGDAPGPGLLLLHGWGADETDLLGLAPLLDDRFFCVSPRAPMTLEFGYGWFLFTQDEKKTMETMGTAIEQLSQFVATLPTRYPIDPAQLYVLGFSQGAVMASALSLLEERPFAGAVLLSGRMPRVSDHADLSGYPVFIGHGEYDLVIQDEAAYQTREALAAMGADVTFRIYPYGHEISMETVSDVNEWFSARLPEAG